MTDMPELFWSRTLDPTINPEPDDADRLGVVSEKDSELQQLREQLGQANELLASELRSGERRVEAVAAEARAEIERLRAELGEANQRADGLNQQWLATRDTVAERDREIAGLRAELAEARQTQPAPPTMADVAAGALAVYGQPDGFGRVKGSATGANAPAAGARQQPDDDTVLRVARELWRQDYGDVPFPGDGPVDSKRAKLYGNKARSALAAAVPVSHPEPLGYTVVHSNGMFRQVEGTDVDRTPEKAQEWIGRFGNPDTHTVAALVPVSHHNTPETPAPLYYVVAYRVRGTEQWYPFWSTAFTFEDEAREYLAMDETEKRYLNREFCIAAVAALVSGDTEKTKEAP